MNFPAMGIKYIQFNTQFSMNVAQNGFVKIAFHVIFLYRSHLPNLIWIPIGYVQKSNLDGQSECSLSNFATVDYRNIALYKVLQYI